MAEVTSMNSFREFIEGFSSGPKAHDKSKDDESWLPKLGFS
jgi:hypothetical protein